MIGSFCSICGAWLGDYTGVVKLQQPRDTSRYLLELRVPSADGEPQLLLDIDAEHWGKLSVLDSLLLRLFSRDALAVLLGQETLAQKNRRLAIELHEAKVSAPPQVLEPRPKSAAVVPEVPFALMRVSEQRSLSLALIRVSESASSGR